MDHAPRRCFYDADCGICTACVRLAQRWDRAGRIEFVPNHAQDRLPAGCDPALVRETIVVVAEGQTTLRAEGVAVLLRALPFGTPWSFMLGLPGIAGLADRAYRAVSRNRHRISARLGLGVCKVESPH